MYALAGSQSPAHPRPNNRPSSRRGGIAGRPRCQLGSPHLQGSGSAARGSSPSWRPRRPEPGSKASLIPILPDRDRRWPSSSDSYPDRSFLGRIDQREAVSAAWIRVTPGHTSRGRRPAGSARPIPHSRTSAPEAATATVQRFTRAPNARDSIHVQRPGPVQPSQPVGSFPNRVAVPLLHSRNAPAPPGTTLRIVDAKGYLLSVRAVEDRLGVLRLPSTDSVRGENSPPSASATPSASSPERWKPSRPALGRAPRGLP